jgi:uncharacterized protein
MDAFVIDAFAFCRLQEQAGGELPVAGLARLADETADRAGAIEWRLRGGIGKLGHPQMSLSIAGQVNLVCQRCLAVVPFHLSSDSALVLASDESAADAIEASIDDEEVDVIVGAVAFDVRHLIEDEALLALPVAPRHDVCPGQTVSASVAVEKMSPFSVLKNLRQ